jgi:hypothetical protein
LKIDKIENMIVVCYKGRHLMTFETVDFTLVLQSKVILGLFPGLPRELPGMLWSPQAPHRLQTNKKRAHAAPKLKETLNESRVCNR